MLRFVQRHAGRDLRRIVERGMPQAVAAMLALCDNKRCGGASNGLLAEITTLALTPTIMAANNAAITVAASTGVARAGEIMRVADAMAVTSFFMSFEFRIAV
jgi:hypothetical protein